MAEINVECINPFLMATTSILRDMCQLELKVGKPYVKTTEFENNSILIMIGVTGEIRGQVILAMTFEKACDIASKMMEQYPNSDNPLKEPAIILIDEIDLHLHPKWQRTVIDKLSQHFPKAQFIATSHSPLIVQAALDKKANIVVCRKEGDKVVIDNNPDEVKGWRIDQILTSDLFELSSSKSISFEQLLHFICTVFPTGNKGINVNEVYLVKIL